MFSHHDGTGDDGGNGQRRTGVTKKHVNPARRERVE
jgi:hypothetical protein